MKFVNYLYLVLLVNFLIGCSGAGIRFQIDQSSIPSVQSSWQSKVQSIVSFAAYFMKSNLKMVTPQSQSIVMSSCGDQNFQQGTYVNVDFVLFVTIANEANKNYLVYSDICSDSGTGQPKAGFLKYNQNQFDNFFVIDSAFDHQRLLEATIRELFHLLGMNQKLFPRFVRPQTLVNEQYYAFLGTLPILKSPSVIQKARTHFSCDTLTGVPIVTAAFGSGVNIFPEFLFQDVVSDYIGNESIERVLSSIGLAVLEDSGWYIVNYQVAAIPEWGKGKGCAFTLQSYKSTTPFQEFCKDNGALQCTFDQRSIGTCQGLSVDPTCLISVPNSKSSSTPSAKLTCSDDSNDYPWTKQTHEVYSQESACFQSTLYSQPGDIGLRCYAYNCNVDDNTLSVSIYGNTFICKDKEVYTIDKVTGSLTCPSIDQIQRICEFDKYTVNSNYCQSQGLQTPQGCFCDAGLTGTDCTVLITCYKGCNSCQTNSALACVTCIDGYQLQDDDFDGVGWCKQTSNIDCPINCLQCQSKNEDKCISCEKDQSLAEVNMQEIGVCVSSIPNCLRLEYVNQKAICNSCDVDYKAYQNTCFKMIDQCTTYIEKSCSICSLQFHLNEDSSKCLANVPNCKVYNTDYVTCKQCNENFMIFDTTCYQSIANCSSQKQDICSQCAENYHWTAPYCLPIITYCTQYASIDKETEKCLRCSNGFIAVGKACVKQITNCNIYAEGSSSTSSICSTCVDGYHTSNGSISCYKNVVNCASYVQNGDQCEKCLQTFQLTSFGNCFLPIVNCKYRDFMDDTKCTECINTAYKLSADFSTCIQPIGNCFLADMVDNLIICKQCQDTFHLGDQKNQCFQNLTLCLAYQDAACSQCKEGTILQIGKCFTTIKGCSVQLENSCTQCISGQVLQKTACVTPTIQVENCKNYKDLTHCGQCNDKFQLSVDEVICYIPVPSCSVNNYDQKTKIVTCGSCNSDFQLSLDQLKCIPVVTNCLRYTDDLTKCVFCQSSFLLDPIGNACLPPFQNCTYRNNVSPFNCLQCNSGFQLRDNGNICLNCPIDSCKTCGIPDLTGINCNKCSENFQLNLQRNKCDPLCQVSYGLNNCLTCPINLSTSTVSCTLCQEGYFLSTAYCLSCSTLFADCNLCDSTKCLKCNLGYYFDIQSQYCYSCQSKYGTCKLCDQLKCTECQENSVLIQSLCLSCSSIVPSCQSCAQLEDINYCLKCADGYFDNVEISDCVSCLARFANCSTCDPDKCHGCVKGFYLNEELFCYICDSTCFECNGGLPQNCIQCLPNFLLISGECTSDIKKLDIGLADQNQLLVYSGLYLESIAAGKNYVQLGQMNPKTNNFCNSDSYCNMNGRCMLTSCKCIGGLMGSRCQFSNQSSNTIINFQNDILETLQNFTDPTSISDIVSRVNTLQALSETARLFTDDTAQTTIDLLTSYQQKIVELKIQGNDLKLIITQYLNTLGAATREMQIEGKVSISKLRDFEKILQSTFTQASQIDVNTKLILPFQRIQIDTVDLKDPKQFKNFQTQYQGKKRFLSGFVCDNQKIQSPQILLNDQVVSILKNAQTNADSPIQIRQSHFYYNPHVNTEGQLIETSIVRIQFLANNSTIQVENLDSNMIILIPKMDQSYSDTYSQQRCLSWNELKQIWDTDGIDNSQTANCRFYIACFTTHLSDFGGQTIIPPPPPPIKQDITDLISSTFDVGSIGTNAAFWISLSWYLLFMLFCVIFWCQSKRQESIKKFREKRKKITQSKSKKSGQQNNSKSAQKSPINKHSIPVRLSPRDPLPRPINDSSHPQLNTEHFGSGFQIPNEQFIQHSNRSQNDTDRNLVQTIGKNVQSVIRKVPKTTNLWNIYPLYSIYRDDNSLSIKLQKVTLVLLQLQLFTTATAGFLSIQPFQYGLLTVYIISPVLIGWVGNYVFGGVAVCLRKSSSSSVNCCYWVIYTILDFVLGSFSVWCMYDLEINFTFYLLFGIAAQFVVDMVFCDLFVAYLYQSLFEEENNRVKGCFRMIFIRGFLIEQ